MGNHRFNEVSSQGKDTRPTRAERESGQNSRAGEVDGTFSPGYQGIGDSLGKPGGFSVTGDPGKGTFARRQR